MNKNRKNVKPDLRVSSLCGWTFKFQIITKLFHSFLTYSAKMSL